MRFNEIFGMSSVAIIVLLMITIIIFKSKLNIILLSQINNTDINIKLNITYLFKLINIDMQLYPRKKKKKKANKEKSPKNKSKGGHNKVSLKDIDSIFQLIKNIEIEEFYSNIEFGNENIGFTTFIYLLINTIYGHLINMINPNKIYLKVLPNFTEDYIKGNIKVHIKLSFKIIYKIIITTYKIYKKTKHKEDGKNESTWFNKKSYGDNA
ncbi:DUF2953 domain-containing protein [Romboutsia sp.]|uniref:DUF2953 domain-containing protein n=1 Tax=Romboutsia sp. TaxID=1965302 RepID=UPI003F3B6D0B